MKFTNLTLPHESIREFCRRWKVEESALFGSALRSDFSAESDIDIPVTSRKHAGVCSIM